MESFIEWVKLNRVKVAVVATALVTAITASAPEHTVAYKIAAGLGRFIVALGSAQ